MTILSKILKHIKLMNAPSETEERAIGLIFAYPDEVKLKGTQIEFSRLKISGYLKELHPLVFNYEKSRDLVELLDSSFVLNNCKLYWSNKIVTVEIQTPEEIFILHEIWCSGCYNVNLHSNRPIIFVDIGMNVGYASLFFASKPNVRCVFAYEPFAPTYSQAIENLKLNPELERKVRSYNFGLSSREDMLEVDYSAQHRGRIGVWGTELILDKTHNVRKEKLQLKKFNVEIVNSFEGNLDCDFVFKIDCEGSEYDIFENLNSDLLRNVKCFLIEWHKEGPQRLEKVLAENGYTTLSFNGDSKKVGMLYAFKPS